MKALSLWQPWATAVAIGAKRIETRSWPTDYRGPVVIHSAQSLKGIEIALEKPRQRATWRAVLGVKTDMELDHKLRSLPRGVLLCRIDLIDCVPVEKLRSDVEAVHESQLWREVELGDYRDGRFGWRFDGATLRVPAKPVRYRGQQMLFDVPDNLLADLATVSP